MKKHTHLKPAPIAKASPSLVAYRLLQESREAIGQAQALYYEGTYSQRRDKIVSAIKMLSKAVELFRKVNQERKRK